MKTMEMALARRLAALRSAPEAAAGLLVDFRDIEHVGDPRFVLALERCVEGWAGEGRHEVFRLAGPKIAVIAPADGGEGLNRGAGMLARVLADHGFGRLGLTTYDLERDAGRLLSDAIPGHAQTTAQTTDGDPAAGQKTDEGSEGHGAVSPARLSALLTAGRSLLHADLAGLVHEQPVRSFADRGAPEELYAELAVWSVDIEDRLGLDIRHDPWLAGQLAEVTDAGVLRHIVHDRLAHSTRRYGFDLSVPMVFEEAFRARVRDIPRADRRRLIAELSGMEAATGPDIFTQAVEAVRDLGFGVAVDHLPLAAGHLPLAAGTAWPSTVGVDFVKLRWPRPAGPEATIREALARPLDTVGPQRLVVYGLPDLAAAELALAAGAVILEGRGAELLASRAPRPAEAGEAGDAGDEGKAWAPREAGAAGRSSGDEKDDGDEKGGRPEKGGFFGRLFGR
jgi:hypothetical protein